MDDQHVTEQIGSATVVRLSTAQASLRGVVSISLRQAKLALLAAGKLAAVEAAINALDEPARTEALIDWQSATVVERSHPRLALIAAAAGLSQAELDELFAAAAAIN